MGEKRVNSIVEMHPQSYVERTENGVYISTYDLLNPSAIRIDNASALGAVSLVRRLAGDLHR